MQIPWTLNFGAFLFQLTVSHRYLKSKQKSNRSADWNWNIRLKAFDTQHEIWIYVLRKLHSKMCALIKESRCCYTFIWMTRAHNGKGVHYTLTHFVIECCHSSSPLLLLFAQQTKWLFTIINRLSIKTWNDCPGDEMRPSIWSRDRPRRCCSARNPCRAQSQIIVKLANPISYYNDGTTCDVLLPLQLSSISIGPWVVCTASLVDCCRCSDNHLVALCKTVAPVADN